MEVDHTFWYLTRAAGFVAYLLLFSAISLGLLLTGGLPGRLQRFQTYDLHRFLALLALAVTLFHVLIVLPDRFIGFTVAELLLPFASPYEPLYMYLGVFSLYLLVIVIGSFYLRSLVSYRIWRYIHFSTSAAFALALVHGLGAGSDASTGWALAVYGVTGSAVLVLTARRIFGGRTRGLSPRPSISGRHRHGWHPGTRVSGQPTQGGPD